MIFVVGQNPRPARTTNIHLIDHDAERRQILRGWLTSTQAQLHQLEFLVWKNRNPNALSVFKLGPKKTCRQNPSTDTEGSTLSLLDVEGNFAKGQQQVQATLEGEEQEQMPSSSFHTTSNSTLWDHNNPQPTPSQQLKPFPILIPCPYTEKPIPSIEQDEHSQLHHHSRRSSSDNADSVDPLDSSPISIQSRQTSTEEIERSQQDPVKLTLNTETVALIVEVVHEVLREEPNKLPQGGPAGSPGPHGQVVSGHNVADLKWNAAELGFFDPNYDNKSAQTASDSEYSVHGTYFRDVHTFIQRAKELIHTKGENTVRDNLSSCLGGIALEWYTAELSPDIKSLVRYGTGIDEWENQLLKRFGLAPHIAMMMVVKERYTIEDARRHREPGDFAGNIIRAQSLHHQ